MKLATPAILLLHWIGIFIYFYMVRYLPDQRAYYGWSVYYFSVNNLTIINYCLLFMFTPREKLGENAKDFVIVDVVFTTILGFTILADYYGKIEHTYGFYIAILGMIIATALIMFNGLKYGLFKD